MLRFDWVFIVLMNIMLVWNFLNTFGRHWFSETRFFYRHMCLSWEPFQVLGENLEDRRTPAFPCSNLPTEWVDVSEVNVFSSSFFFSFNIKRNSEIIIFQKEKILFFCRLSLHPRLFFWSHWIFKLLLIEESKFISRYLYSSGCAFFPPWFLPCFFLNLWLWPQSLNTM